ncbi:MAG: hypothetical protein KDK37_14575 [Leptospiraceae bacterium]|nr:hypothetical protein [Leptospiraceae bacterium]
MKFKKPEIIDVSIQPDAARITYDTGFFDNMSIQEAERRGLIVNGKPAIQRKKPVPRRLVRYLRSVQ